MAHPEVLLHGITVRCFSPEYDSSVSLFSDVTTAALGGQSNECCDLLFGVHIRGESVPDI